MYLLNYFSELMANINNKEMKIIELLRVFEIVLTNGSKQGDLYEYKGIKAWSDFDGYTCWLVYKDLTITLLFHGKYSVESKNESSLSEFYKIAKSLI